MSGEAITEPRSLGGGLHPPAGLLGGEPEHRYVEVEQLVRGLYCPQSFRCLPADVEDHALALGVGLGPAESQERRAVVAELHVGPDMGRGLGAPHQSLPGLPGWRRHAGRDSSQRHLAVWALDPAVNGLLSLVPFRSGVCFVSGCPREPQEQTEPASAEGVQQTVDAVVERLLLLNRVVEHLAKAAEGGVVRVFKNARLLNTFMTIRLCDSSPDGRMVSNVTVT